jgi:thymidylate kinase
VREGYRQQLAQAPEGTWLEIDATQAPEAVEAAAWEAVAKLLGIAASE